MMVRKFVAHVVSWVAIVCATCAMAEGALPTPPQNDAPQADGGGADATQTDIFAPSPAERPSPSLKGKGPSVATPPQADVPRFKARSNMPPGMQSRIQYGGGVFEESYFRGLQQPMRSQIEMGRIPTATGGCNTGFPMQPFRWGYFGAEPREPRPSWHRKYYGDKVRSTWYYGY
jgi:hypothetical protein